MENIAVVEKTIVALRKLGFHLSIDDFGTGYSSLARLREIKFDSIKIDRAFIDSMLTDTNSMQIVRAVIELTKQLGIVAIAEGIETIDQCDFLKEWHCRYGQGYYFAKPLLANDLLNAIEKNNGLEKLKTKGLPGRILKCGNEVRALGHDINNQLAGLLGYTEIVLQDMPTLTDEYNVVRAVHMAITNGFALCHTLSFELQAIQRQAKESASVDLLHQIDALAKKNGDLLFRVLIQLEFSIMPLLHDKRISLPAAVRHKLKRMLQLMINLKSLNENLINYTVYRD